MPHPASRYPRCVTRCTSRRCGFGPTGGDGLAEVAVAELSFEPGDPEAVGHRPGVEDAPHDNAENIVKRVQSSSLPSVIDDC